MREASRVGGEEGFWGDLLSAPIDQAKGYQGGKYVTKKTVKGTKYVGKKTVKGTKSVFSKTKKVVVGN